MRGRLLLVAALLAGITLAAYAGVRRHAFVNWDDPRYVTENPLVLGHRYGALLRAIVSHHYHPLTMISLALNVATPLSPRPFLVTNVALHVLNTLLVFALVLLLTKRKLLVAAFVALLFGIHPMHVESVAWVAERKDVLYASFFLLGLLAYWRHATRRSGPMLALAFVLFLLSCLAKGQAVVFPLVLVLLDFWAGRRLRERRAILEKVPFFAVALLFGVVTLEAQAGHDLHGLLRIVGRAAPGFGRLPHLSVWERAALPTYGYLMYVWQLFVPTRLCTFHPYPQLGGGFQPLLLVAPLFFVATLVLAAWGVRHARPLAFGLGWYLVTMAPVLQWVPVGGAIMADRYFYLSSIGLFLLLGLGLDALGASGRPRAVAGWGAAAVFALLLFAGTRRQVGVWADSETLWTRNIQIYPRFATAYVYRGRDRYAAGRPREALFDFRAALALGMRGAEVYEGLGSCWTALGGLDSALVMFDRALAADPEHGRSWYNRGAVLLGLGHPREAVADLDRAVPRVTEDVATVFGTRAYAKMQLADFAGASADFDSALARGATDPAFSYGRGFCRLRLGDRAGAVSDFRATLRLDPRHAAARAALQALGADPGR